MHPIERLRFWQFKNRVTNTAMAKKLKISRAWYQRILGQYYAPDDRVKKEIDKITSGEPAYEEWLTLKMYRESRKNKCG